jgi:hypothetical protein
MLEYIHIYGKTLLIQNGTFHWNMVEAKEGGREVLNTAVYKKLVGGVRDQCHNYMPLLSSCYNIMSNKKNMKS